MFFLVGFLLAGAAALVTMPAFARRAARLSEARARLLAPLSRDQAIAERDQLRAEHAVEICGVERRLAAADDAVARYRADLGRQASSLVALESLNAEQKAEIARQRNELEAAQRAIAGLQGELGASAIALNDFTARLEQALAEIAALRERRMTLETQADQTRTVIAGLETRASGLEIKLVDIDLAMLTAAKAAEAERDRLTDALLARTAEVRQLSGALAEAMTQGAIVVADLELRGSELRESRQRLAHSEAQLQASENAREDALVEASRQLGAVAERDRAIGDAEASRRDLETRLTGQSAEANARSDAASLRAQMLSTSQATLEGALQAARAERAALHREVEQLRARLGGAEGQGASQSAQGDQALREAISRLALDVVRLSAAAKDAAPAMSDLAQFGMSDVSPPGLFGEEIAKAPPAARLRALQAVGPES